MWRARHRGPRTPSRTTDANLDCAFVENALVFVAPKIGRARAPPVRPPDLKAGFLPKYCLVVSDIAIRFCQFTVNTDEENPIAFFPSFWLYAQLFIL